jgi:hypothetical protein
VLVNNRWRCGRQKKETDRVHSISCEADGDLNVVPGFFAVYVEHRYMESLFLGKAVTRNAEEAFQKLDDQSVLPAAEPKARAHAETHAPSLSSTG